jgi:gluconokinase
MGVAGCGKSTVAPRLCAALADDSRGDRLPPVFIEGDDHHPPANVAKMSRGEPLTDHDRQPWLETLAAKMGEASAGGGRDVVLACSALKGAHRATLAAGAVGGDTSLREVHFLHLDVSRGRLEERLGARAVGAVQVESI